MATLYTHVGIAVVVTLTGTLLQVLSAQGQCVPPATTPGIREIVLGRCHQYQTLVNPDQFCENGQSTRKNCTELADLFVSAFASQPTCNVTFSRYDNFIQEAHFDVASGQSMFWSDVYGVVQRYSGRGQRARVLEDTLIGYMGDGLRFCAQEAAPGIIYDADCAGFDQTQNCSHNAEFSFWAMASKNYASTASGDARVMLNASLTDAYRDASFFGVWEMPNLNPTKLSKITILLVNIPGQEIRSTCQSANIANLQSKLKTWNITSSCEESPWGPQAMLCMDYPDEEECKRQTTSVGASIHCAVGFLYMFFISLYCFIFTLYISS